MNNLTVVDNLEHLYKHDFNIRNRKIEYITDP
jgi:hypothetical protein